MNSKTTSRFWKCYSALPDDIKNKTKKTYQLFVVDPYHPSLHYKRVHSLRPIFSIRITIAYRAIGILQNNEIVWFWIGSHSEYDRMLKQLRNT